MDNNENALKTLKECSSVLDDAFEASNDMKEKTQIYKLSRIITSEIERLVGLDLAKRSEKYKPITEGITKINKRLKDLKGDIDDIIVNIDRATKAIGILEKAIVLLAKYAA